jgi:hypothetical protein
MLASSIFAQSPMNALLSPHADAEVILFGTPATPCPSAIAANCNAP